MTKPSMHRRASACFRRVDHERPATIVIAGGGVVGLVLALLLRRALPSKDDVVIEVYDRAPFLADADAGAGLGLFPNGLRVLRDIGPEVLQGVRGAGAPYHTRRWERPDGTCIMDAEEEEGLSAQDKDLEPMGIRRSKLHMVLLSHAHREGIPVFKNKAVQSVTERRTDGLVTVTFADGTTRRTRILFGADGAHSRVRSFVAKTVPDTKPSSPPKLRYTGVQCLMGLSTAKVEGISFPSSDEFHAVFFPTGDDESCFQFHMPVHHDDDDDNNNDDSVRWGALSQELALEQCQAVTTRLRAEGWHDRYLAPLQNVTRAVRVGFEKVVGPDRWVKGRVALLGDAAHPPVPYLGQGAQQGMEDAGVAVSLLKIYCIDEAGNFDPTNFEKAMTMYQEIRMQRSTQLLEFSQSLAQQHARPAPTHLSDNVLKGEVLMYGTLPVMWPGATHHYKHDVRRVTERVNLPHINQDEAVEALRHHLGFEPPMASPVPWNDKANNDHYVPVDYTSSRERQEGHLDWLVDCLSMHLKRLAARKDVSGGQHALTELNEARIYQSWNSSGGIVADEVEEIVDISQQETMPPPLEQERIKLPRKIVKQVKALVQTVTTLYRQNPFHNFEHACEVTMAVSRFLSVMTKEKGATLTLKDGTYGIVSDPLCQFAVVFAALMHDADHEGVPNAQLMNERPDFAASYGNKSIAEQRSVDVAFETLMKPEFRDLRMAIYRNESEMRRFRQLVVNAILATDIADKDLREFRNQRWSKAFSPQSIGGDPVEADTTSLKATIGIELLMQVSDILHTMQPWKVYKSWNERLFSEMYRAYCEGRSKTDPSTFWFKGEIGFFDFYIIPLAEKLQSLGIFGSMGEDCLRYATANRQEWLLHGPGSVNELMRKVTLEISQRAACTA